MTAASVVKKKKPRKCGLAGGQDEEKHGIELGCGKRLLLATVSSIAVTWWMFPHRLVIERNKISCPMVWDVARAFGK